MRRRVLLVSSFVLPHSGGVEQFVETTRTVLEAEGARVRVLACRRPGKAVQADATVPTRFVPPAGWPLVTGGLRTVWREVGHADVVVTNNARQPLSVLSAFAARLRRRPVVFVLHGAGPPAGQSHLYRLLGGAFVGTIARLAVRSARPVSVSRAGVAAARELFGVEAEYLPYPISTLPPVPEAVTLDPGEPLRIAWVGRLHPEKAPLLAVEAVDRLRAAREATLDLYGDGPLRRELNALASAHPWLTVHGARPWREIVDYQAAAHVCLSTSVRDNVQVAALEALARGIPVVTTRVGDAPAYYTGALERFCVPVDDALALADALRDLAASYGEARRLFADNGRRLREEHARGARVLTDLVGRAAVAA